MKKVLSVSLRNICMHVISIFFLTGICYAETATVLVDKANIYISNSSLQVIAQGVQWEEFEVISKDSTWYQVRLDEKVDGWIRKKDVGIPGSQHEYSLQGKVLKSYSDDSIKVSVEEIESYYVTKIWLQNPAVQVKKASADWGTTLKTTDAMLDSKDGAIVGCNGSGFYLSGSWSPRESEIKNTSWNKTTEGYLVITDGQTKRKITGKQCNSLLGILPSGSLKYYENNPYEDVINDSVENTFTFGPLLVKDGKAYAQEIGKPRRGYTDSAASLTTIGQIDANNFVIISTRTSAKLTTIANFGVKLGCNLLYNFDGGGSSSLWFRNGTTGNGAFVKNSSRPVGDALYFVSLNENL